MHCRERRSWTAKEDELLRAAVQREDPENPNPSKWHAIAKHVPNRTNKDCRKRWFAKMASDVVKGGWSPDEDEKLVKGIERFGTRWSLVASIVQSRNSDQCAKRWTDTLNPAIDRTTWTPEADELLLQAVQEHGKVWTKIVKTYFPGRTGLSAKNRYNSITRFTAENSRSRARRKSPEDGPYKTESVSSSSSSSASPSTPSLPLPNGIQSPFPLSMETSQLSYALRNVAGWPSSSSIAADDIPFHPSPNDFNGLLSIPSTPSTDASESYNTFELTMDQTLSAFSDDSHIVYSNSSLPIMNDHHVYQSSSQDAYTTYSQFPNVYGSSELPSSYTSFEPLPSQIDPLMGLTWENGNPTTASKPFSNFKMQQPSHDYNQYSF